MCLLRLLAASYSLGFLYSHHSNSPALYTSPLATPTALNMTSSRFAVLISISALSFASASELLSDRSSTLPAGLVKRHYTPELCRSYGFTWNYYTNTCVDTSTDVNNCSCVNTRCITSVANASPVCRDSTCKAICNTGYTAVDGMCKDQASDSQNCGRQGNVCQVVANALQNVCTNGLCIMSCKTGYVLSSGQCILKPSQAPRKRKLVKELSLCPAGETLVAYSVTYKSMLTFFLILIVPA